MHQSREQSVRVRKGMGRNAVSTRTNSSVSLNNVGGGGLIADNEPLKFPFQVGDGLNDGGIVDISTQCFVDEWIRVVGFDLTCGPSGLVFHPLWLWLLHSRRLELEPLGEAKLKAP